MDGENKLNVVLIGNSGVGKSTLINSINGFQQAKTGAGESVTTDMQVFESDEINLRLIDTKGFEYGLFGANKAIAQINSWARKNIKDPLKQVHVIWYCVDATSKKVFAKNIDNMLRATKALKNTPIIVVLTKSYSDYETEENIKTVEAAFAEKKNINLKGIIPVVAERFVINEENIVSPKGIIELVEATYALYPEAMQAGADNIKRFELQQKRKYAHGCVALAVTGSSAVGAVPIPIPDAPILVAVETLMIKRISKIYDVNFKQETITAIISSGAVSVLAKEAIKLVKLIPGLNLAAAVINAIIAGIIVATLGESVIMLMEAIYSGKINVDDINKIMDFVEDKVKNSKVCASIISVLKKSVADGKKLGIRDICDIVIKLISK